MKQKWQKFPKCQLCGKRIINHYSRRCWKCYIKSLRKRFKNPKKCPGYKHGKTLKIYKCIDCKKKISDYRHKRCRACALKYHYKIGLRNNKGKNNPAYKHGKPKCIGCGKKLSTYKIKRCCSCEMKRKWREGINKPKYAEKNSNWRGGSSLLPYPIEFTENLKESIRKRDNHTCQVCGLTEKENRFIYNKKLPIHHIDYNKINCKEENLISLCIKCHLKTNGNRDYWINFLKDKQNENRIKNIQK